LDKRKARFRNDIITRITYTAITLHRPWGGYGGAGTGTPGGMTGIPGGGGGIIPMGGIIPGPGDIPGGIIPDEPNPGGGGGGI